MAEDVKEYAAKSGIDAGAFVLYAVVGVIAALAIVGGTLIDFVGLI